MFASMKLADLLFLVLLTAVVMIPVHGKRRHAPYGWFEYTPIISPQVAEANATMPQLAGTLASTIIKQPVYVSMTTISTRLGDLHKTISEILMGPVIPDRIYLFVSRSPYLLDEGIRTINITPELNVLAHFYPLSIVFVENIGPHRKLLPLLDRKWREDCVIITMDDEMKYWLGNYVHQLIKYYAASGKESVVTLKARRLAFCDQHPHKLLSYTQWGEAAHGMHEFFLLPTGTGGILYRPKFFHPVVFDRNLLNLTRTTDDLAFRLATMVKGVFVATGCRVLSANPKLAVLNHVGSTLRHGHCDEDAAIVPSRLVPLPTTLSLRESGTVTKKTTTTTTTTASSVVRLRSGVSASTTTSKQTTVSTHIDVAVDTTQAPAKPSSIVGSDRAMEPKSELMNSNRRLRAEKGLYTNFNMREGNDKSAEKALNYLAELQLLDMTVYVSNYLAFERPNCFEDNTELLSFPGGNVSCMLQTCRKWRPSK
jgi:hypothetical protein